MLAILVARKLPQPVVALEIEGKLLVMGVTAITRERDSPPELGAPDWVYLGKGVLVGKRAAVAERLEGR